MSFRTGFYAGAVAAVILGLFVLRLWQPEQQVRKHSAHLLDAISHKNWAKFGTFMADDYHDQWGNDRAAVMERSREVFGYLRGVRFSAVGANVRLEQHRGFWSANILIDGGEDNDLTAALKTRVNTLRTPFELEWHRMSGKPWDWKLVSVHNAELTLPTEY